MAGWRVSFREVGLLAGSHHVVARVLLRVRSVEELLEAVKLAAPLLALQVLKLFYFRLHSVQVLR